MKLEVEKPISTSNVYEIRGLKYLCIEVKVMPTWAVSRLLSDVSWFPLSDTFASKISFKSI